MSNSDHAKGASKSLQKTISDIMKHRGDDGERPNSGLRPFLEEKIGDLAESWFRRGFNRGHKESYAAFKLTEAVPMTLDYSCSRSLAPNQDRELELSSTIKIPKRKPAAKKTAKTK